MGKHAVEKHLPLFLIASLLLHVGLFIGLSCIHQTEPPVPREPIYVDIQNLPTLKPLPEKQHEPKRSSDTRSRVTAESAPRGQAPEDTQVQQQSRTAPAPPRIPPGTVEQAAVPAGSSLSSLLKPKEQRKPSTVTPPQLFPQANRLAKLEESYRRKFEENIAEGDTRFLNSDDITFGSFLRRFEGAVYGVWRYPQEAAMKGIEGITPIRITFNRRGDITNIQQLESSGFRILDEEVIRTLRAIGPVGGFPRGYDKDEFHLIAFFQYGGSRRSLR